MDPEREIVQSTSQRQGSMTGVIQGEVRNFEQFVADSALVSKRVKAFFVRREAATIGPQGEEEHAGERAVSRPEFVVRRPIVLQEPSIGLSAIRIVDVGQRSDATQQGGLVRRSIARRHPSVAPKRSPAPTRAEYVAELDSRLSQEVHKIAVAMIFEFSDHILPTTGDLTLQVGEDYLLSNPVEDDLATRRQRREPLLYLVFQSFPSLASECPEPKIEPELLALVPDEVKRGQNRFSIGLT
jgi:hypothetical protein